MSYLGDPAGRGAAASSGRRYRFLAYHLRRDGEPATTAMQCAVCAERSGFGADPEDGTAWALDHLARTRTHFTYRLLWSQPVRAVPGAWL